MKRFVVLFWFLIAMFLAVAVITESGYAGNWTKKTIAEGAQYPSIVIDKNGNPHIFYVHLVGDSENDLIHSWFDGKQWHSEKLDTVGMDSWSSGAVDQEGKIHLAYGYNLWTSNPEIKYAIFDGNTWNSLIIESGGYSPAITIAPDGFPRIIHVSNSVGTLRYLSFDGVSWTGETIGVSGSGTSMGFLPDGSPVVAWSEGTVRVARRDGNVWNSLAAFPDGYEPRIAADGSGTIHLLYIKGSATGFQYVYARYEGTQWQQESLTTPTHYLDKEFSPRVYVGAFGVGGDIAVNVDGTPNVILNIVLRKKTCTESLIYGFFDETGWHSHVLVQGECNRFLTQHIVLNSQGIPCLSIGRFTSDWVVEYYQHKGMKLSVSVIGDGRVTSMPEGIDCGSDCSKSFFPGASVTLTAIPSPGMNFLGWWGACRATNSTCTLSMDKNNRVTAAFGP